VPAKDPTVLMSVVAPDEPEGYRGRRRRFLLPFVTRKAGGAALPALLVAASIVVVLIVVGVSQLLPKQAAGQIPSGSGNGAVSNDGGAGPDPDNPGNPSASGSAKPNRSASAKPSASGSGSASPSASASASPSVTPSATDRPFGPLALEAESATLGGGAKSGACSGCSGSKVRFIGTNAGWVTFGGIDTPKAMTVDVTIVYVCGSTPRTLYVNVNNGGAVTVTPPGTGDWNTTGTARVRLSLPAGVNSIKFFNPTASPAPDLDRITVQSI
jgi:hypothetical protein